MSPAGGRGGEVFRPSQTWVSHLGFGSDDRFEIALTIDALFLLRLHGVAIERIVRYLGQVLDGEVAAAACLDDARAPARAADRDGIPRLHESLPIASYLGCS